MVLRVLAGGHLLVVGGGAAWLAFPTPWRRLRPAKGTPGDDDVPYESVRLADGCPAWLTRPARGSSRAAVCLCHGRSRSKAWLRPLIRSLTPDFTVLAFDFKSHGENAYGLTTVGQKEADTVDCALDLLAERGFDRVLLYGCSMGGAAAIISQGRQPHASVHGLVTDGTFASFTEVVEHKAARLPGYLRMGALCLAGRLAGYDPWSVRPIDVVEQITVPLCFLHGDSDRLVPASTAARMAERNSNAEVIVYPGAHDQPDNLAMQVALREFAAKIL